MIDALDRLLLHELTYRYARGADERRADDVAACFTDDARLEFVSTGTIVEGSNSIRDFFRASFDGPLRDVTSSHLMTNTIITAVEDEAERVRLVTTAVAYLAGTEVVMRGITYTDECVRTPKGWRIAVREHRLAWQGSASGGPRVSDEGPSH